MFLIRKASIKDLNEVLKIYDDAIEKFEQEKTFQWKKEAPPNEESFKNDLVNNELYVATIDSKIIGVMTFLLNGEEDYNEIDGSWINDERYLTIHRIAVLKEYYGKGIGYKLIEFAKDYCLKNGYYNIRIDTHVRNFDMKKLLTRNGFVYTGIIKLRNKNNDLRDAYQIDLKYGKNC